MKPTTETLIKTAASSNLTTLLDELVSKIPDYTHNETTISEAGRRIKEILVLIRNVNSELIDELSYSKRTQLGNSIMAIETFSNNIKVHNYNIRDQNVNKWLTAFFTQYEILKETIDISRILDRTSFSIDIEKLARKHSEIEERYNQLNQRYQEVIRMRDEIFAIKDNIESMGRGLNEKSEGMKKMLDLSDEMLNTITNAKKLSEFSMAEIKNHELDIESKRLRIMSFSSNIEEMSEKNAISERRMNEFVNAKEAEIKERLDKYNEDTKLIIEENKKLQERVEEILQGANAGELFQSFNLRKAQVEKGLMWWLIGIVFVNALIVVLALFFSLEIKDNPESLGAFFYIKTLSAVPLILLDVFLIREYNRKRDLAEEYAFRGAISLSFLAYRDVVDEMEHGTDSMKFVVDTVQKIYEYPFDKQKISKKQIKNIEKYMDKGVEIVEKLKKN